MDIQDMDIKDLKALAYDVSIGMQQSQQYLVAINQEIAKKQQQVTMPQMKKIEDTTTIPLKEKKK
jgi:hypothetical protein